MANLFINMENVISRHAKCGAERSAGGVCLSRHPLQNSLNLSYYRSRLKPL